jgi:capsular exopolysaccharide synthesis family protein
MQKPGSHVAESVRSIRMSLRLAKKDPEKKSSVITITSSSPDEGKTTLSSSMARLAAKSGEKTILIDCDLRRPKLQEAFGQKPEKTLVEYLTGKATLDDIIVKDKESGANVIFARAVPSTALDLISKDRMKNLIGFLRQNYNLVLLDSAASLAASDAKFLSSFSDHVIYTVAWNETSREVVNTGLKQFADIDENALALILTKVDIKRQSLYDGAIQYYNRNKKYYSD